MATRRDFLRRVSVAAVPIGIAPGVVFGAEDGGSLLNVGRPRAVAELTYEMLAPLVKTKWFIRINSVDVVPVKLIELEHDTARSRRVRLEQISLIFRGPKEPQVLQGMCQVEHPRLGYVDLFLVPIETDLHRGQLYQAVFSRFL